jgi:4-hydroxy-2-oxoheptanedioate aldolase
MRNNLIKAKLQKGEPCRGLWLTLPSVYSTRLLARLPIDWLAIDAEHAPIGVETFTQMTSAIIEANGPAPLIRISQSTVENFKFALDAGAYGVIAPMINSREEVERVVAWSKFPPVGQRSFGSPYAGLAFDQSMTEYLKQANEETLSVIMVENKLALDHLDEMFSVPGIDLVFVGPVDLSISLGLEGIPENPAPLFQEALNDIKRCAQDHHLPLGIFCSTGKAAAERIQQGFLLVNVGSDTGLLQNAVRAEIKASK